ncbi:hypothetical protein CBR_g48589 [Chara braunii]|uniref:Myb/SANT-like DNA-binding domain-containing protein n=1 Tax=Chara braunii TaxID=69332 RepID=A0A388M3C9_CHABU|nr:hypothetical protein CBR_g48589 [Chara braunii]|eukprot:GBG88979.1 hypothetical protein CBR_g48589 [Chara braunii]
MARTQWGTRTTPTGTTTALKVGRTTQATFRRRRRRPLCEGGAGRRSRVAAMVVGAKGRQARAAMPKVTSMVRSFLLVRRRHYSLIRAKRDQDAHLQGMGHVYARMKPREWKWLDVATRLKKVGVEREADWCGKKWDNLMQQFKKVHHFQGLSGKQDFFQLSGKDMMSKGFSFNMDRAVYDEILGSTAKKHTINPKNVADTGAQGGVRLPSASSADPESVGDGDGGAEHDDDDDGSTKGSSQTTGGAGGFGKRKSTWQQTFEAMTECMEKHGALMASTMESNNKRHCSIAVWQCRTRSGDRIVFGDILVGEHIFSPFVFTAIVAFPKIVPLSSRLSSSPRSSSNTTPTPPSLLTVGFDSAVHVIEASRANNLAVDVSCAMSSRGSARGKAAANLAQQPPTREKKGCHMANKKRKILQGAPTHGGYVVDEEWVPEDVATQEGRNFEDSDDMPLQRKSYRRGSGGLRIDDAGDRRRAGGRAAPEDVLDVDAATAAREGGGNRAPLPRMTPPTGTQEGVVRLRTPFTPRSRTAADVATGTRTTAWRLIRRRLVGAFTSAVIIAKTTDGGRVLHERLKTMADAMRMMLAATMWLMRMAGDDHRAHYDAWVFVQLTAKPTLVASMHRCFNARRHIVQAATVITDKLASPPITLIDPPMYVPDWASIGVKFSHDATLSSPMEAKKVDWLGTGPPEDEDDGKGDEQGSGGGR